jgi:RimJ/RimL family protein N-acetyltransferase
MEYATRRRIDARSEFDKILSRYAELECAEQTVIERDSGKFIGYSGAYWFYFDGRRSLGFSNWFRPEVWGKRYALEAGEVLLAMWAESFGGEMLALIHPKNGKSKKAAPKLGFNYLQKFPLGDASLVDVYRLHSAQVLRLEDLYMPVMWTALSVFV